MCDTHDAATRADEGGSLIVRLEEVAASRLLSASEFQEQRCLVEDSEAAVWSGKHTN